MLTSNINDKQLYFKPLFANGTITLDVPSNITCKELITSLANKIKIDYEKNVYEKDIKLMHGDFEKYVGVLCLNLENADELDSKISKKYSSIYDFLAKRNSAQVVIKSSSDQKPVEEKESIQELPKQLPVDQKSANEEEIIKENENCILM